MLALWQPFFLLLYDYVLLRHLLIEPYIFWFYNVYFLLLFNYCLFLPSLLETLAFDIVVLVLYHYSLDPSLLVMVSSSVLFLSEILPFFGSTFPVFPSSMSFFVEWINFSIFLRHFLVLQGLLSYLYCFLKAQQLD